MDTEKLAHSMQERGPPWGFSRSTLYKRDASKDQTKVGQEFNMAGNNSDVEFSVIFK